MEYMRYRMISWSKYLKLSKFANDLGIKSSALSIFMKYGTRSISEKQVKTLYNYVLDYMKSNFA